MSLLLNAHTGITCGTLFKKMVFWFRVFRRACGIHPLLQYPCSCIQFSKTILSLVKQPEHKFLLILKEHMLHLVPINVAARPEVKHYRKKSKQV